jgi:hypothetical protein
MDGGHSCRISQGPRAGLGKGAEDVGISSSILTPSSPQRAQQVPRGRCCPSTADPRPLPQVLRDGGICFPKASFPSAQAGSSSSLLEVWREGTESGLRGPQRMASCSSSSSGDNCPLHFLLTGQVVRDYDSMKTYWPGGRGQSWGSQSSH